MVHRPEVIGWPSGEVMKRFTGIGTQQNVEEGTMKKRERKKLLGRAREERRKAKFVFVLAGGGRSGGECDQPRSQAFPHRGDGSWATTSSGARAAIGLAKVEAAAETIQLASY